MHVSTNRVNACLALPRRARARATDAHNDEEQDLCLHRAERFDDRAWSINEQLPETAPLYN
jgi:hypothetical protein